MTGSACAGLYRRGFYSGVMLRQLKILRLLTMLRQLIILRQLMLRKSQ